MPSGAELATRQLREALATLYAEVIGAGKSFASAFSTYKGEADLVQAMARAGHLLLAAESLAHTAELMAKAGRTALSQVMLDTGCSHATDGALSLYLSRRPKVLSIDDLALLPPQFLRVRPPEPDRAAIKEAFARGDDVAGCSVLQPNEMTLNIRVERRP